MSLVSGSSCIVYSKQVGFNNEETKVTENKRLEEKVIRYALVYLNEHWDCGDAEDMEIDELVLDGTLRRLIKNKGEEI